MQLLKKNKKLTSKQQPGMGSGDGGWGAMWAVTPPMNECIGVLLKNIRYWTQIRPEIWKYLEKNNKKTPYTIMSSV